MLGEILRGKREGSGFDLHEVARKLRIQYEHLRALEEDALEKLPPDVYVRGYIREYAKFLSIDPAPLLHEYSERLVRRQREEMAEPSTAKKSFGVHRILLLAALVGAVAVVLGLILYSQKTGSPVLQPVQEHRGTSPSQPGPYHTLDVIAIETTWLRIETGEGEPEETLLKPGETRKWFSESGFSLKLGNAGGVRLVLNGRDMGVPGEKGRVLRLTVP